METSTQNRNLVKPPGLTARFREPTGQSRRLRPPCVHSANPRLRKILQTSLVGSTNPPPGEEAVGSRDGGGTSSKTQET